MKKAVLVFALMFSLLLTNVVYAFTPSSYFYVTDQMGVLSQQQIQSMVTSAQFLREGNGVQVVAAIVEHYYGGSIEEYANRIFNEMGIGSENDDNGVLLLVAVNDGALRIEVGDGLSDIIPDSLAGRIAQRLVDDIEGGMELGDAIFYAYSTLISEGSRAGTTGVAPPLSVATAPNTPVPAAGNPGGVNLLTVVALVVFIIVFCSFASMGSRRRFGRRRRRGFFPFFPMTPFGPRRMNRNQGMGGGFGGGMGSGNPPQNTGGGGQSSGGGASRGFSSGLGGGLRGGGSFGGNRGGGGRSSGGGASRGFRR